MTERPLDPKAEERKYWIYRELFRVSRRTKPPYPPKIGETIGSWTILGAWTSQKGYLLAYKCRCSCGTIEEYMDVSNLKKGNTSQCKSCGGVSSNKSSGTVVWSSVVFPLRFSPDEITRLKFLLNGMIARCKQDHHVKARISVYPLWIQSPIVFIDYISDIEGWDDPILIPDRIDTFGGYTPGNIRFISNVDNSRNRTDTVYINHNGEKIDIMAFIESQFKVERARDKPELYNLVYTMAKRGKSSEDIIKYVEMRKLV